MNLYPFTFVSQILRTLLGAAEGPLMNDGGYMMPAAPPLVPLSAVPVNMSAVCLEIASATSSASEVFLKGTETYARDINHFSALSTQDAACSFEPGTANDVGIALQILGQTRYPFAVKGGGHTMNPGFSSTPGVQIAMCRFSDVIYDSTTQTATIGAGLIWDDVYAALEPYGVNVAGARVSGVGVAGFTLGGGYAWHTNQYGLAIDTVDAFELVLPNGTVTNVDAAQADLFFALKGGFNNFGIVTRFKFKAFPQSSVWGGSIPYDASQLDQLTRATAAFAAQNTDPKANILTSYGFFTGGGLSQETGLAVLFYDAPSPPPGLFDAFLTDSTKANVFTRSHLSLVQSPGANMTYGLRQAFHAMSALEYTEEFLSLLQNETVHWGRNLPLQYGYTSFNAEPILPDTYNHTTSPSAWPGTRALPFSSLSIMFGWAGDGSTDDVIIEGMKQGVANLEAKIPVAKELPLYGNYALADTPIEDIYGANVERLRAIKREVDPGNVMGLAGGFKF